MPSLWNILPVLFKDVQDRVVVGFACNHMYNILPVCTTAKAGMSGDVYTAKGRTCGSPNSIRCIPTHTCGQYVTSISKQGFFFLWFSQKHFKWTKVAKLERLEKRKIRFINIFLRKDGV